MGRSSFELHARPNVGLFSDLRTKGHDMVKIVMSNKWKDIPEKYSKEEVILCNNWTEVKDSVSGLRLLVEKLDSFLILIFTLQN